MTGEEIYNKFYKEGADERSRVFQHLEHCSFLNGELEKFYSLIKKAHAENLKFSYTQEAQDFLDAGGCFEEGLSLYELVPKS